MQEQRKYVGSFIWPFVRYDVLMPQQIKTDLFEWLYLALVVHQNEQRSLDKKSYTKEVKDEVRRMIRQKFASLLDETTIDNIISASEREFTVKDEVQRGNGEYLTDDVFSFLDTYEDLFSSQVDVQRVFQDGICGDVVPCFKEMDYIKDARKGDKLVLNLRVTAKPSQEQIKNAYVMFNRLNTVTNNQEDTLSEMEEFYDKDAEVDFEPEVVDFEESDSNEKFGTRANFSAHFIDNARCEYNLEVSVFSDGEKLYIDTPFDFDTTLKWMSRRLTKARSVCEELDKYLNELEAKYTTSKTVGNVENSLEFVYRKGVADQLTKCGDIYRLVERLPQQYNDLKKILIEIDKQFVSRHKSYFNSLGNYLECLIHQFAEQPDADTRRCFDYAQYCLDLNYICNQHGVNVRPFLSENIFNNWRKGWTHFKADLAWLFISNAKMRSNSKLYPEFVQDAFDLYDSRNNGSHYKPGVTYSYEDADIEKLFNVTRVLLELI